MGWRLVPPRGRCGGSVGVGRGIMLLWLRGGGRGGRYGGGGWRGESMGGGRWLV